MKKHLDPAWLDAQYNNRARIPDHAAIFERWARASELTRSQSLCHLDIAYGEEAGETLDVFPTQAPKAPVLVFIHGGYWRSLDKSDHSFVAASFVAEGAQVVVPNYALCPAVTMDQIVMQTVRALVWVYRNAAKYGGDPERIVVVGHSAGGHLAAMLACCQWKLLGRDLPAKLIKGAISISGLYDLEPLRHTPYVQPDLRLTPALVKKLSPAYLPAPKNPLYAMAGSLESEEFLRQNDLIAQAWGAKAVPVCERIPACHHLDILHDLADSEGRCHQLTRQLLALA